MAHCRSNVLRLLTMRCTPVSRCGGYAIAVPRTSPSPLRCISSHVPCHRIRGRAPRAVADVEPAVTSQGSTQGPRISKAYPFAEVEKKWQTYWDEHQTFRTPQEVDTSKPKYYVLDMFPYPRHVQASLHSPRANLSAETAAGCRCLSIRGAVCVHAWSMFLPPCSGSGLHVGHPEGYTATDITARYKRMTGHNVLHPMGWDAFGLPAEQYALQTGTHPRVTTEKNVARFKEQLKMLGFSYDWRREVSTTEPSYYKWTQWIFTKLLEKGLAYQAEVLSSCHRCHASLQSPEGCMCEFHKQPRRAADRPVACRCQ